MAFRITAVRPSWSVPGGRILLEGTDLPLGAAGPSHVRVGSADAHVITASRQTLRLVVPATVGGGTQPIEIDGHTDESAGIMLGREVATGLHQVDNPAFDWLGRLYATHSGGRGVKVPTPIHRITPDGAQLALALDLANPTSLALGPDGAMYVSSRFEGSVYRLSSDDKVELYATELGVPTGLAFATDGTLFVGDRSGSILRVTRDRRVDSFATLPASVAAFHLAFGPDQCLYVAGPTLASRDPVYRITPDRLVSVFAEGFGRPQGLAFDSRGDLYVVDALAGAAGLFRLNLSDGPPTPEFLLSAPALVGVAFDPAGGLVVASGNTIWRLDVPLKPSMALPAHR